MPTPTPNKTPPFLQTASFFFTDINLQTTWSKEEKSLPDLFIYLPPENNKTKSLFIKIRKRQFFSMYHIYSNKHSEDAAILNSWKRHNWDKYSGQKLRYFDSLKLILKAIGYLFLHKKWEGGIY